MTVQVPDMFFLNIPALTRRLEALRRKEAWWL